MSKTKVNSRKVILVRAYLVFGLLAVFAIAIFVTAVKLQLGTDDKFREEMSAKNTRIKEIEALRGNIYADDGSLWLHLYPNTTWFSTSGPMDSHQQFSSPKSTVSV
jgi:cell division protein FtsI/penicillin-binding protein 2